MGLLMIKGQGGWLSVVAMLAGSLFLLKFLLDSHPGLVPADLPIGAALSSHRDSRNCHNFRNCTNDTAVDGSNSFLPCRDYVRPGSSTRALDIVEYFHVPVEDSELLHAAQDAATVALPEGKPKVAFLFILRQKIPMEPLWERFFADGNDSYSIYTHPSWWADEFPQRSLFHNRSIATKEVKRFDISLVDVVRRLLAFALLDTGRAHLWFVLVSEACIPVRSFPFVYNYLMNSSTSFIESFSPLER
jgi:hypothetical protein